MYVYMRTYIHTHTYNYTLKQTQSYMHTLTHAHHIHTHKHFCTYTHTRISTFIYTYSYMCMNTCVYMCMYTHTHTHTYIHTYVYTPKEMNKYVPSMAGRFGFRQYFVSSSAILVLTYHCQNRRNKRNKKIARKSMQSKGRNNIKISHTTHISNQTMSPTEPENKTHLERAPGSLLHPSTFLTAVGHLFHVWSCRRSRWRSNCGESIEGPAKDQIRRRDGNVGTTEYSARHKFLMQRCSGAASKRLWSPYVPVPSAHCRDAVLGKI